jgi:hypothetical protein
MFRSLFAFSVIFMAAGSLFAQQLSLPAPGGPGGLTPPPSTAGPTAPTKPTPSTPVPPIATSPVETTPTAPVDPTPAEPISYQHIVYTIGATGTRASGSYDYTFKTDPTYNTVHVIGVVGTSGHIYVNSVRIVHDNGSVTDLGDILVDDYHADQGRVVLTLESDVAAIIVNARNSSPRGQAPGTFRVDVSVSHK